MSIWMKIIGGLVVGLLVGFFVGQEYTKYTIRQSLESAIKPLTTQNSNTVVADNNPSPMPDSSNLIPLNQESKLASISVKVKSSEEKDSLTLDGSAPQYASSGTKYVIVNLTVTNLTTNSFPMTSIPLVDDKGRKFDALTNLDTNNLMYKTLAPSIPTDGVFIYNVPTDSQNYLLETYKGSSNDLFKFKVN